MLAVLVIGLFVVCCLFHVRCSLMPLVCVTEIFTFCAHSDRSMQLSTSDPSVSDLSDFFFWATDQSARPLFTALGHFSLDTVWMNTLPQRPAHLGGFSFFIVFQGYSEVSVHLICVHIPG